LLPDGTAAMAGTDRGGSCVVRVHLQRVFIRPENAAIAEGLNADALFCLYTRDLGKGSKGFSDESRRFGDVVVSIARYVFTARRWLAAHGMDAWLAHLA